MNPYLLTRSLDGLTRLVAAIAVASLVVVSLGGALLGAEIGGAFARASIDLYPVALAWVLVDGAARDVATGEAVGAACLGIGAGSRAAARIAPLLLVTAIAVVMSATVRPTLEGIEAAGWADASSARALRGLSWSDLSARGAAGAVERLRRISEPLLGLVIGWLGSLAIRRWLRRTALERALAVRAAALIATVAASAIVWILWTLSLTVARGLDTLETS